MSNLTSLSSQSASKTDAIADCSKVNKVYLSGYSPFLRSLISVLVASQSPRQQKAAQKGQKGLNSSSSFVF